MKDTKKYIKLINSALLVFMTAILILTLLIVFVKKFGLQLNIGGVSVFRIITGSMEPAYSVGDYVVLKKVDTATLNVDDVVAFISTDEDIAGEIVVHRIKTIEEDGFVTGGDANPAEDYTKTTPERIVGVVTKKISILKTVDKLFSQMEVFVLLIALPILLMIAVEIYQFFAKQSQIRTIRSAIIGSGLNPDDKELFELVKKFGTASLAQIAIERENKNEKKEHSDEK